MTALLEYRHDSTFTDTGEPLRAWTFLRDHPEWEAREGDNLWYAPQVAQWPEPFLVSRLLKAEKKWKPILHIAEEYVQSFLPPDTPSWQPRGRGLLSPISEGVHSPSGLPLRIWKVNHWDGHLGILAGGHLARIGADFYELTHGGFERLEEGKAEVAALCVTDSEGCPEMEARAVEALGRDPRPATPDYAEYLALRAVEGTPIEAGDVLVLCGNPKDAPKADAIGLSRDHHEELRRLHVAGFGALGEFFLGLGRQTDTPPKVNSLYCRAAARTSFLYDFVFNRRRWGRKHSRLLLLRPSQPPTSN